MNPAWTYSQLDTFTTCPRKFYHLKVKKDVVEPPTEHTEWGTRVHSALENFVRDGEELPDTMKQWEPIALRFKNTKGKKLLEYKFAIGRDMQPCEWGQAWSRGIADVVILNGKKAVVADWKTGKRKPTEQLQLYVNYVFSHFPEIDTVTTSFVWLKERKLDNEQFTRGDIPQIWNTLMPRIVRLEKAYERDQWEPKPSGLCNGWCPVGKARCEFWKPRRT